MQNRLCPALDREHIARAFSSIPAKIDVLSYKGPLEPFLGEAKEWAQREIEREKLREELASESQREIKIRFTSSYDDEEAEPPKRTKPKKKWPWWIWLIALIILYLIFK